MSRGPTTFRQRDVTAAIKAAKAAGLEIVRIEVDKTGRIVVVTRKEPVATADGVPQANEWDSTL